MMGRRGFLGRAILSPLMAKQATSIAADAGSVGFSKPFPYDYAVNDSAPSIAGTSRLSRKLFDHLRRKESVHYGSVLPTKFRTKVSWSPAFAEGEAIREVNRLQGLRNLIEGCLEHDTETERIAALLELGRKMGLSLD